MSSTTEKPELVCVTGGSGCIGSWLVHLLLLRGYSVHATVQNLKDENETKHLEALEGAEARLRLFQIDLLDYDSIAAAVSGCSGVFHVASPCIVDPVEDPERDLLDPAIKGTINVLTAAKEAGVQRVVVTSSISSMIPNPNWPRDYEEGKRSSINTAEVQVVGANLEFRTSQGEELNNIDSAVNNSNNSGRHDGIRSWVFVAAPIVGLAGIALMLWFGSPRCDQRVPGGQAADRRQLDAHIADALNQRENRSRRWW